MEQTAFEKLVGIMARLTTDPAVVFELYADFGTTVAAAMRRHLRDLGMVSVPPDDLDGMVIEACLALARCASGWDPSGGALPWTWASARLRSVASDYVGVRAEPWDATRHDAVHAGPEVYAGTDLPEFEVLRRLAAGGHAACALLVEALERVASARDRAVFVELRAQSVEGDPSPAVTIGLRHRMEPDAVRQVGCRVRRKLRALAAVEPRFAGLAELPLVA